MLKMIRKSLLAVFLLLCVVCDAGRRWDYEPISIDTTTSDSNKFLIDMRIKRIPFGEFVIEGYMNFAYDLDDNSFVEAVAYRSPSGREEDYVIMPWTIPKQPYSKYIEDFYEDMIYKNLAGCSNLPKPESALPWKRENITFNACVIEGEGMPEMAPQGYYKVIFTVTGEVNWDLQAIVKIFDKVMP